MKDILTWMDNKSELSLPRDRATINAWCRSFFALNSLVRNAVDLHTSNFVNDLVFIDTNNDKVNKFFSEMRERIYLDIFITGMVQEYWIIGEDIIYGELDEINNTWDNFKTLNPDYINIKRNITSAQELSITLRPDVNLKRIVRNGNSSDFGALDQSIVEHVRRRENIPLNNFYTTYIARKLSPYEIRGTSIIVSCFRDLLKLESEPDNAELINKINTGLMVPNYTDDIALKLLCKRYTQLKFSVTKWLKEKVFAPISKLQDFYEYDNGEKKLIVPGIIWNSDKENK